MTAARDERERLSVEVWRGRDEGRFETFAVPHRANQTVLDVVTWIQRHAAPALAYRFACRVGVCGSCAMTVNGRPRWTCRTHVSKVAGADRRLRIEPLRNLPRIKDLAVDLTPFFEKWQRAQGRFTPTRNRADPLAPVSPESPARKAADAGIECINCAVCHAACDVVGWDPDYLGPAALNRAWTLVNDERDGDRRGVLQAAAAGGGCHSCHTHGSCVEHCPVGLNPTAGIAGLKRRSLLDLVGSGLP
ncbi:fumarate reductase [Thalassobaculum fulvum]|uniref:Succinate dehydrogenase iron-sulfur subunit n=1 Tax=Thalassobaculum fulvum TaxID=1633335 RepID=A0A918XVX5_9PROT|nr:2Fe-2S iron-sulfur cluster-binding protein [Thalassobaculum fulvum]GHD60024.1 fumarate reductase [Thalassobaculum fulvum]